MTREFNEQVFESTYRDDYKDSNNFHRMLFNDGRPLQARELTQMQTIIQEEMARFADNIFVDGAAVNPGSATVSAYEFIKLDTGTNPLPADPTTLELTEFTGQTSGVVFRVLEVIEAEGADPATLYGQYVDTSSGTAGTEPVRMSAGEDISNGGVTLTVQTTNTSSNPAVGIGTQFSNSKGDFYTQGHFVFVDKQSIIIDKYGETPTVTVGFLVLQDIVTEDDDVTLYDNTGANPNLTAPGAHRYRIRLQLTTQDLVDSADNFIFFVNVRDGLVVQQSSGSDDYNRINDLLAVRTEETNGDFIVDPFTISFDEDSNDDTKLVADISDGTAYVNGYRVDLPVATSIRFDKPTSTTPFNNQVVAADYGNYVFFDTNSGLPNVNTFELLNVYDATGGTGSTLGTVRVRAIEEDGSIYRAYLFDLKLSAGQNFRNARSIGTGTSNYIDLVLENSNAVIKDASSNDLLFPLPTTRPQTLSDISLTVQRRFQTTTDGGGTATITLSAGGETFADNNLWVFSDTDSAAFSASADGAGTQSSTITGGPASQTIEVYAYVNKGNGGARVKTLTETTIAKAVESDGSGLQFVNLGKADIFQVNRITLVDSDGQSLSNRFTVDNGQRDNAYELGRLLLKSGSSSPSGNVFVRYKYFSHGTSGDFFCVNSYSGQVNYDEIPSHRLNNGEVVELRDVIDFRPVQDSDGEYSNTTTGARINELPRQTDLVTSDATYYNGRNDLLVAKEDGLLEIVKGAESLTPKFPEIPNNSLLLYRLELGPNTLDTNDIDLTPIESRRYTMSDISDLEDRLDNLIETTALSLIEINADTFTAFDSTGVQRLKTGIFTDAFSNQDKSAVYDSEYKAAIDPQQRIMRSSFQANNVSVLYDSDLSTNTVRKGDIVLLKHTTKTEIAQVRSSRTENVNPFAVIRNLGTLTLSPGSDTWFDTQQAPDRVVGGGLVQTFLPTLYRNWGWQWVGTRNGLSVQPGNPYQDRILAANPIRSGRRRIIDPSTGRPRWANVFSRTVGVTRVSSSETIRRVVGNRVVDVLVIPWMRSRTVYFKAEGLRPNTRYFPFFDGRNVEQWCREETFKRVSNNQGLSGTRFRTASSHPSGSTQLISDGDGLIEGSFFLPNSTATDANGARWRFRTGNRLFRLLDVSVNKPNNATSRADARYVARGRLNVRRRDVTTTRVVSTTNVVERVSTVRWEGSNPNRRTENIRAQWVDPLAQSFFVESDVGIYVNRVRLYFASKDSTVPVQIQIRPMVNGVPSSDEILPGSIVYKNPSQINIPTAQNQADIRAAGTNFFFEEPVYLQPRTDYALVVLAESTQYNVYIAQTQEFLIGSTEQRVARQPSLGSLFKSQNGSTWEPSQNQDLAFVIYRCEFTNDTGEAVLENESVPRLNLDQDPFSLDSGSSTVTVNHAHHGLITGDTVNITGLDSATTYGGIAGTSLLGDRTVIDYDATGYTFAADSAATTGGVVGGDLVEVTENILYDDLFPQIEVLTPDQTNLSFQAKFTSGQSYAGSETRFAKDAQYTPINNLEDNELTAPQLICNDDFETAELGGDRSLTISVPFTTNDSRVSPIIDLQRCSVGTIGNLIDNQDSAATSGFNVPLNYVPETDPAGGSAIAKHVTIPVTLVSDAVGLKIILNAHRSPESTIDVYYRTATEGANLQTVNWTKIELENSVPSDENRDIFREYEYLAGGQGGNLTPFTQFQIKTVFNSTNNSQVPLVEDIRVIALSV